MSSVIRIYLNNSKQYYLPGEIITGRVECSFSKEKTIRAILVKFKGKCSTSWNEIESGLDDISNILYSGKEVYFNEELNIAGADYNGVTLLPGKHVYPFSYQLPTHIPPSYENEDGLGNVRYTVTAKVDCAWALNLKSLAVLHIVSPVELSSIPRIREVTEISVDKNLCSCWCNGNDSLTFTFTVSTIGHVPGQEVKIDVYVQNLTNVSVQKVIFEIIKLTRYIANSPTRMVRHNTELISASVDGGIGAHSEKSWTVTLHLPLDKSFPNMNHCNLINVTYLLKGGLQLPYPHSNLSAHVPLQIGCVPLTGESFTVNLGTPPEIDRIPYADDPDEHGFEKLIPSDNTHGSRNNYARLRTTFSEETAPPPYEEVVGVK